MALGDVAKAADAIGRIFKSVHLGVDAGYALALAGLAVLIAFGVAVAGILAYKGFRALVNMTPVKFLLTIFILAWVLLLVGSLLP